MADAQIPGGQQANPMSNANEAQQPAPQQVSAQQPVMQQQDPAQQPAPQQPAVQQQTPAQQPTPQSMPQQIPVQQPVPQQIPMQQAPQPMPPYPPVAQPEEKTNLAVASLILGIVGLIVPWLFALLGYICGILAITFGVKTLKTSKRSFAIAGIVLGIVTILFSLTSSAIGVLFALYYF